MTLTVNIITPERSLPTFSADHVTLPAFDGEVGIRTGHAPFVCLLGIGNVRIKSQTVADTVMALRGGVAQVVDNDVKILAESVAEADRVSEQDLVNRLQKLNAATYADPMELTRAKAEAHWYITQLKLAGKAIPDVSNLGL
jgi:F-type H+-transporting ATPase subunit epsilon